MVRRSQFESYRSLGAYVIRDIFRKDRNERNGLTPRDFADRVKRYLEEFQRNHVNDGATVVDIRPRTTVEAA
jgi:hypothetical protein